MLDGFNDELVIAGQVEERAAGPRVGQLNQGLVDQGVLRRGKHDQSILTALPYRRAMQMSRFILKTWTNSHAMRQMFCFIHSWKK